MDLPYNAWSKIEISQREKHGFYFLSMKVNDESHPMRPEVINTLPRRFEKTTVSYVPGYSLFRKHQEEETNIFFHFDIIEFQG